MADSLPVPDTQPSGDVEEAQGGKEEAGVKLLYNPVHQHYDYSKADNKSTCKICKYHMSGKNPTSLCEYIRHCSYFYSSSLSKSICKT